MSLIAEILPENHILLDLNVTSKKRVFEQIGFLLENEMDIKRADIFECLFEREKLGSTGLGDQVAIPHGCLPQIKQTVGVFVRTKEGIPFDAPDGLPVRIMFILLAPEHDEHNDNTVHLQILSELAEKLSSQQIVQQLLTTSNASEIKEILAG